MSAAASTARNGSAVSTAIGPFRTPITEDAFEFTLALLALAEANAKSTAGFNEPSPQDAAALQALAHWRRDAHHALQRLAGVASGSHGKKAAVKWLKALVAAIDLQRQALSLVDPNLAVEAAASARTGIAAAQRLEQQLDRVLA